MAFDFAKEDFKGILFAKFDSKDSRNRSVESFRKASLSRSGSKCWASEDAPIEERASKSFLFGIKNLLIQWGFGKFELWVDTKRFEIYLNDEFIASAATNPSANLEFKFGEGWEEYLKEGNLDEIVSKANNMISRSRSHNPGKGKEKSKLKSKSKSKSKSSE